MGNFPAAGVVAADGALKSFVSNPPATSKGFDPRAPSDLGGEYLTTLLKRSDLKGVQSSTLQRVLVLMRERAGMPVDIEVPEEKLRVVVRPQRRLPWAARESTPQEAVDAMLRRRGDLEPPLIWSACLSRIFPSALKTDRLQLAGVLRANGFTTPQTWFGMPRGGHVLSVDEWEPTPTPAQRGLLAALDEAPPPSGARASTTNPDRPLNAAEVAVLFHSYAGPEAPAVLTDLFGGGPPARHRMQAAQRLRLPPDQLVAKLDAVVRARVLDSAPKSMKTYASGMASYVAYCDLRCIPADEDMPAKEEEVKRWLALLATSSTGKVYRAALKKGHLAAPQPVLFDTDGVAAVIAGLDSAAPPQGEKPSYGHNTTA